MFPRSIGPIAIAALALTAWLHARGVSALVGSTLGVPNPVPPPVTQVVPAAIPPRSADPILARNPFDSVTGPLLGAPPVPSTDVSTDATAACDGVRVVTIVAADDPAFSLVVLDVRGEREPILRRRGGEVLAIAPDRVLLQRDGTPCIARIFAPAGAPPPPPPAAVSRGIVRTGADSFALDRGARDALIDGAGDLMRSVAVRPEKQGDDVVGLRIATLKPGTPLDALGVRAGDVLLSLDGIPLTSPDRMLQAYARVRTEERVRVVVQRDGRQLQLDYQIR